MKNKLAKLHKIRYAMECQQERLDERQAHLEKTVEYEELKHAKSIMTELSEKASELGIEIRKEILVDFNARMDLDDEPNKKPYDGIQIKEFQTLEVTDEKKAIQWAVDSGQFNLVSLAKSNFKKVAKVLDLEFVKKGKEYRAQIASDLSMYEEKEDE
jgi:hypothetical protein